MKRENIYIYLKESMIESEKRIEKRERLTKNIKYLLNKLIIITFFKTDKWSFYFFPIKFNFFV